MFSLNEECHQEGGDISPSVDDELPGVGETEDRTRSGLDDGRAHAIIKADVLPAAAVT